MPAAYPDYGEALRHSSLDTEQLKDVLSAFGFERSDLKTLNLDVETEYWRRKSQRNCCPFGILARFERNAHKGKMVCGHSFQNANIPRTSSDKKMMSGDFCAEKSQTAEQKTISQLFCAHSLYEHCAVAQNGFCDNGKYHEQHDTLHGHMRDTKNITQIDAANQQSHTTA